MIQVSKQDLQNGLNIENPWWTELSPLTDQAPTHWKRPFLQSLMALIQNPEPRREVVLLGPRRVGKTYLLQHAISALLTEGVPGSHILYVAIDNPLYVDSTLRDLLASYSEVTGVDWQTSRCYVFFDEIQYLANWEQHLKTLHDSKTPTQFVVSGSAARAFGQGSRESGAGRFTDLYLPPLTFSEFLELRKQDHLVAQDESGHFATDIDELNRSFLHYLNFGGYPEIAANEAMQSDSNRFMRHEIIDKVLLRDLPSLYGISDVRQLHRLFTVLALNSGNEISLEDLSRRSTVGKQTLRRYLNYLEAAFLIRLVTRVDRGAKRFQRDRQIKIYLTNPSLRTGLFVPVSEKTPELGHLVETGVFAQQFHQLDTHLHYARWKVGSETHEIDLVTLKAGLVPETATEIKFTDRLAQRPKNWQPLLHFCRANKLKELTITTRTIEDSREVDGIKVILVPTAIQAYQTGLLPAQPRI